MKGEQKYEEMVQVLDHLHQYVPTMSTKETFTVHDSPETIEAVSDVCNTIILGI